MTETEFLGAMDEILGSEEQITLETKLDNLEEWDSLSALMFQSMIYKQSNVQVTPADVRKARTIGDLYELIKQ